MTVRIPQNLNQGISWERMPVTRFTLNGMDLRARFFADSGKAVLEDHHVDIHHDLQRHGINQFIAFKRDGKEPYAYESKVAEDSSAKYSDQHGCTQSLRQADMQLHGFHLCQT